jgi:hypothetical protein
MRKASVQTGPARERINETLASSVYRSCASQTQAKMRTRSTETKQPALPTLARAKPCHDKSIYNFTKPAFLLTPKRAEKVRIEMSYGDESSAGLHADDRARDVCLCDGCEQGARIVSRVRSHLGFFTDILNGFRVFYHYWLVRTRRNHAEKQSEHCDEKTGQHCRMSCILASIDFYTITLIPSPITPVFFRIYYGGDKFIR